MAHKFRIPLTFQILSLLLVIFIVYHNILKAPFLWDDEVMIAGNSSIKNTLSLEKIFTTGAFGESLKSSTYYRPIQILSYWIDYHIWKLNPFGFHITSLIFHFLGCTFLLFLLRRLFNLPLIAFIITFIFAIHPINIENITYLSGRGDVLCTCFTLLSLLFLLISFERRNRFITVILSMIFFVLALFSKENTVFLPLVLISLFFWKKHLFIDNRIFVAFIIGAFFLVMAGYLIFRLTILVNLDVKPLSEIAYVPGKMRIFTIPAMLITYLRLLIVPFHYHMEYHFFSSSLYTPDTFILIAICIIITIVLIKKMLDPKELQFYFIWFIVFLLPVLNMYYPLAATVREHWVSFSSIALFMFAARFIEQQKIIELRIIKIPVIQVLILVWIVYIGFFTYIRNKDWTDPFRLYSHDVKLSENSFILWNNLGVEYFRKDDMVKARECFERSRSVCPGPGYAPTFNNLGVICQNNSQIDSAKTFYQKAIQLDDYILSYQNLGQLLVMLNDNKAAIGILEKGKRLYPEDPEILYFLGIAYFQDQNIQNARQVLTDLDSIMPGYKETKSILQRLNW
jgi:hypothetical protein